MSQRRVQLTRKLLAIMGLLTLSVGSVVFVVSVLFGLSGNRTRPAPTPHSAPTSTTTTQSAPPPGPPLKPLPVRTVQDVRGVAADGCPPADQASAGPPTDVLTACDVGRTAIYTLGPQAMELAVTQVDSLKSPDTDSYEVRLTIQPASAIEFAGYTARNVGVQLAFVRDGVVVFAPRITEAIKSTVLQISGNLTAEQADQIAGLLRKPA
jgi:hypothetical protein